VHLAGIGDSQEAHERLAGYRDALADAGLPYDEALVVPGDFQILPAEASIGRLLRDGVAFDAVFAANDMSARGTALSAQLPYREVEERLAPGDMLVLSSDGIVEAMNEQGELYGFDRFADAIARGPQASAAMLAHLFADVAAFSGAAEMHDDMAIVVACYREQAA